MAEVDNADATYPHAEPNMTVGTRRQANGTIGSVYSGNKIRHLKKEDGIPLWRKDIQYQFLKLVFEDKTPVFSRWPDGQKGFDFADVYIDAMARSSKTSKILKDKLQNDKQAAISMAMVCLLVNFGRMNTTLNFFPEMRAQLRTYHSIPSLQAHQDPNAYKQLQDAPRLKSILKGASEDVDQPNTLEMIKNTRIPRTNPVNLIFVLAQYAPKVSELHFFPPRDFFDLVMRSTLSSKSRARAFLWLMWWYLESDFSHEAALNNPFGPGLDGEGTGGLPIKVPNFESLTEDQANDENVDTQSEIEYGEAKRLERKRILEEDEPLPRVTKRSKKVSDFGYDDDQGSGDISGVASGRGDRSTMSTPLHPSFKRYPQDDEDDYQTPGQSSRSRYKRPKRDSSLNRSVGQQRLVLKTRMEHTPDAASPVPPGSSHPVLNRFVNEPALPQQTSARRPRPLTQHQLAVEQNRRQRIEYLLAKRKNEAYRILRAKRESEIPFARYGRLLQGLPDGYDTEDEENTWGKGGLIPNPEEEEDFGENASYFLSVVRKAGRRLDRWDLDDANGPKRDRKKEREERQKDRLNRLTENALDVNGRAPTSARSRARAARNARRKLAGAAADASAEASVKGQATSASRPKSSRSRGHRDGASARMAADNAALDGLEAPSRDHDLSPMPASGQLGDDDIEGEVEEGLDDIDRELLGEGSGDEDEGPSRIGGASRPSEPGYEDSFMEGADEDAEALSSDDNDEEADEDELDEGEGEIDDNSSTFEGGHGYAASETSSVGPEAGVEAAGGDAGGRTGEKDDDTVENH
ncbi:hypothetical protein EYZ11_011279 [Aspergillus tanneri]|uniref:Ino eighty subunit 1 n=1 Tax=Aspergillus tanneri TaxID=1220188 RepID=A0A4S3J8M9_9EURO|nr:hypothetical protein EYZ11_011279 [Aspergillus tanneri]